MNVWQSSEFDNHEQVCSFSDEKTGLRAIVAIHSTFRGPAAGGTRFKPYDTDSLALDDALRLSRAMSYKSALAGLPVGGGKSVIIGDPAKIKTRELLHAFGRFIDRIGNVYATGEDVGVTVEDMETINEVTPYVGGTSQGAGDPSIHTAVGVLHGLRAVASHKFGRSDFSNMRIAVQGLGSVGRRVAQQLHDAGAKLIVADVNAEKTAQAREQLGAVVCSTETIHAADVDIFCPCALGGVVTEATVTEIQARAVAGAANNQLSSPAAGGALAQRDILFAPDYVINAGGIISGLEATQAMPGRKKVDIAPLPDRLAGINSRLMEIFRRSELENQTPDATAQKMAQELIGR
ncbi:MAG: NAD(P)-binding domain-containing protein [Sphingomonadales bacterium]|nr:NAD(P)-binding domain-containing protein [Sphingomonadales bacterium]